MTDTELQWTPGVTKSPAEVQNTMFAHAHTDLVLALPEPGREYLWEEVAERVPAIGNNHWNYQQRLQNHNAIKKHHTERHNDTEYAVWETDEHLYRYCERLAATRPSGLPCGHRSGFTTIDADAGVYECGAEWCDARYDRDTITEVFG